MEFADEFQELRTKVKCARLIEFKSDVEIYALDAVERWINGEISRRDMIRASVNVFRSSSFHRLGAVDYSSDLSLRYARNVTATMVAANATSLDSSFHIVKFFIGEAYSYHRARMYIKGKVEQNVFGDAFCEGEASKKEILEKCDQIYFESRGF